MPTYVILANFTQKGLSEISDTMKRVEAFKTRAKSHGAVVKEFLWTQGAYDMVCILEAPDETSISALILSGLKLGTFSAQTLRGFTEAEMAKILEKVS
jgi:uncharacterized protein with GYD domain